MQSRLIFGGGILGSVGRPARRHGNLTDMIANKQETAMQPGCWVFGAPELVHKRISAGEAPRHPHHRRAEGRGRAGGAERFFRSRGEGSGYSRRGERGTALQPHLSSTPLGAKSLLFA